MSETPEPTADTDSSGAPDGEPTLEADLAVIANVEAELEAVEAELVAMDQERDGEATAP